MPKVARNQACPCGSGKKYKRCCLPGDEAAASKALRQSQRAALDGDADDLTDASNAVVDLVHAGHLDEAEAAARELRVRYPEVVDGYERLAQVAEARGDRTQAADYYRQALAHILEHPDGFDGEQVTWLVEQINDLDPLHDD